MRSSALPVLLLAACASARTLRHRYYVLRHGQSMANVQGIISSDPAVACNTHGLSDGLEQARAAAEAVCAEAAAKGLNVAIVSSDFCRAWQTAQCVADACAKAGVATWPAEGVAPDEALRERDFGEFNGEPVARYDDVWAEDARSAFHTRFGVESVQSVRERAAAVVERMEACAELTSDSSWMIVLVAHGDVLQILQTAFAGVDASAHRSLPHLETATLRALGAEIEVG